MPIQMKALRSHHVGANGGLTIPIPFGRGSEFKREAPEGLFGRTPHANHSHQSQSKKDNGGGFGNGIHHRT